MDNWLLIIVATIFIVCIAVGYIRGFLKLGISLLSTVLTLVIVLLLSPYVRWRNLHRWTILLKRRPWRHLCRRSRQISSRSLT